MEVYRTSKMVEDMKPVWAQFIVDLGYTIEQGKLFADGYAAKLAKLPIFAKLQALSHPYDPCMTAGFEAAEINEAEALKRSKNLESRVKK